MPTASALSVVVLYLCPLAASASPLGPPGAEIHRATVLGVAPTREVIVRVVRIGGAEETWSLVLPRGPAQRLRAPPAHDPLPPLPMDTRIDGLSIDLDVDVPLGDRGRARLMARDAAGGVVVVEPLPPPGPRPRLAALWSVGRFAIAAIDRPGDRRSLHVLDVARARARILDGAALTDYLAGRLAHAIARWQEAAAADPTYGDAPYNLACAYARGGALDLARRELDRAIALDGPRYRLLSRLDPDLTGVRSATISVDPAPSSR